MTQRLFCLDIEGGPSERDLLTGLLCVRVAYGWEEEELGRGRVRCRIYAEKREFLSRLQAELQQRLPRLSSSLEAVASPDWLTAWRQFFTPLCFGARFVVLPSWLAASQDYPARTKIVIEPKNAFGTGQHASTALCLEILSGLLERRRLVPGQSFLDLGTGSGILGIACSKSGLSGLGLDVDPMAVDNALENRLASGAKNFEARLGSIDAVAGRRFDLLLANILAGPLAGMARAIVRALAPGACLVLSGLLCRQADEVERAYRQAGLGRAARVRRGEWCALVWE